AGELEYFLPSAIDLSIEDIAEKVKHYGGLTIPAHIDRAAMSMTSQLGVVTPGAWDALECVRVPPPGIDTLGYPLISASDAHYPEEVARRPFELDISPEELQPKGPGTEADIEALRRVLNSFYRF
ncbi:MAG: histidinol-phosphatase, partial [Spirochaetaceae bacterium]|nr:histidinol-phosphatase [Spirochaetaceae bacterium]